MTYTPPRDILDKYAKLLINYGLNGGSGPEKGDVVSLVIPESAKPFVEPLMLAVLEAGCHPIIRFTPDGISKAFFEHASQEQLEFLPEHYFRGLIEQTDHGVHIIADFDKRELADVDPKKLMARQSAMKPAKQWRDKKEDAGEFSWTLAVFGTPDMAKEAGMSEESYWEQIIKACYLDEEDPVATWRDLQRKNNAIREKLDALDVEKFHVKSENTDLWVKIGKGRKWLGATGQNIPSFEVYISPDWRGTQGTFFATEPLYRYGTLMKGIRLVFEDGIITDATADEGEDALKEMIAVENADKVGEFSLTDKRFSRITKFMAENIFDENVGGEFGNTHIAVGNAYRKSYTGDPSQLSDEDWAELGYNESAVHTDVISTEDRVVTAHLADGSQVVIYKDGMFTL